MMAQSARQMTPAAKRSRPVQRDAQLNGAEYVEVYGQAKRPPSRLYRFRFSEKANPSDRLPGTWANARKIGNTGMAKRSWFWGLRNLPGAPYAMGGKPYRNVARMLTLRGRGDEAYGLILENRLAYITKILPADYEAQAARAAGNRILTIAARKIEADNVRDIKKIVRGVTGGLARMVA